MRFGVFFLVAEALGERIRIDLGWHVRVVPFCDVLPELAPGEPSVIGWQQGVVDPRDGSDIMRQRVYLIY